MSARIKTDPRRSLIDRPVARFALQQISIGANLLLHIPSGFFWTSTILDTYDKLVWVVYLQNGSTCYNEITNRAGHVLPVKSSGGQKHFTESRRLDSTNPQTGFRAEDRRWKLKNAIKTGGNAPADDPVEKLATDPKSGRPF